MRGQREAKREGGSRLPWIITGAVVGVLAAAYLGTCAWAAGREAILPNVSVAGIDVSNMTVEQAKDVIVDAVERQGKDISVSLAYEELEEGLDAVSDDLSDVEDVVFEDDEDDGDYDDDWFEVECPNCGADILVDDEALADGEVECPGCGTRYAMELSDEEDEEPEEEPEE